MSTDPNVLELLVRGGAAGAFIALALAIVRGPFAPARVTGFLFCLAAAAHTLTQHPQSFSALGFAWRPVWVLSVMGAGLFWAFAAELFEDRPNLAPSRFAPAALLLAIGIGGALSSPPAAEGLWLLQNLIGAALMAHVVFIIWTGWQNDLVESRRRLRGPILAAGAVYALAVIAVQIVEIFWRPAEELSPLAAGSLLLLGLVGIAALLRADADLFASTSTDSQPSVLGPPPPVQTGVSGEEGRLAGSLDRLMREERLYRAENLSIGALASKLGVPEYRLRRLINQGLGYRNFNAYLNRWRLGDAIEALSDPAQREVPISTIALDAGFQSLGPFNRAFKAETGLTPSEYRARALESSVAADASASRTTT